MQFFTKMIKKSVSNVPLWLPVWNKLSGKMLQIPIVIISLTTRCNSHCRMCNYWQIEKQDFPLEIIKKLSDDLPLLHCKSLGFTGGEPLLHPYFEKIITELSHPSYNLFLLSNATLFNKLKKPEILNSFNQIFISLDGPNAVIHDSIRGKGMFELMSAGISLIKKLNLTTTLHARSTVQMKNWKFIPDIVDRAKKLGFQSISFVAVDNNSNAYGWNSEVQRVNSKQSNTFLQANEYRNYSKDFIETMFEKLYKDFKTNFIEESKEKLFSIIKAAVNNEVLKKSCNAPLFSVFIDQNGDISPCFLRPPTANLKSRRLFQIASDKEFFKKQQITRQVKEEYCKTCTCPLYRGLF